MYILQVYLYNIYQVRFGMQPNVWRYITFACPDHLGGDGVVFACTAHAKTCFRILIYPAVFVYLGNQKLSFLHLLIEED